METDPRKLFQRLFGQGDTPQERACHRQADASVLDIVRGEAADAASATSAPRTSAMLADYLESVREIERRVAERRQARPLDTARCPTCPARMPSTSTSTST